MIATHLLMNDFNGSRDYESVYNGYNRIARHIKHEGVQKLI